MAADTVAARLGVDPATVRVVVRMQLREEIADAIENVQEAAARRDEDPHWYAEANLHARRLLREYGYGFSRRYSSTARASAALAP
jgi:hypothetical protein